MTHIWVLRNTELAESSWSVDTTVLCTATLVLAKYCASVWCCSAHTHLIDKPFSDALCIMTRHLHPTPMDNLFILADIQPTELYH